MQVSSGMPIPRQYGDEMMECTTGDTVQGKGTLAVSLPDEALARAVGTMPGVELFRWDFTGQPPSARLDIAVPPYMSSPRLLTALGAVNPRLVQSQSIGYDGVADVLPPGTVFANAAGVHETSTAELALALILASQRNLPQFIRQQDDADWRKGFSPSLADRRVLLLGYGGVGKAIEHRLRPFEVEITRLASNARADDRGTIHSVSELSGLLSSQDIVVVSVPLNERTFQLVNSEFLSKMPDGSLLVNIARGPVVDTSALVREVSSGRLRAALDVTDPEPLPRNHVLWTLPNVLMTPHVGGASSAMLPRIAKLIREQIRGMQTGQAPKNVVLST